MHETPNAVMHTLGRAEHRRQRPRRLDRRDARRPAGPAPHRRSGAGVGDPRRHAGDQRRRAHRDDRRSRPARSAGSRRARTRTRSSRAARRSRSRPAKARARSPGRPDVDLLPGPVVAWRRDRPQEERSMAATETGTFNNFIDGESVAARGGPDDRRDQPRRRQAVRAGAGLDRRGRRPRRQGRPRRLRRLVEHDARRALAGAAEDRRRARGARRRDRRARVPQRRQAAAGGQGRRDRRDGRQPALLRGRRAQPGGQGRGRVPRGLHVLDAPRGGRRDRPDRALELPAADGDLEDRAGAGRGQHDRAQARPERRR